MFTPDELIDNSNLDRSCIRRMGLHLNKTGNAHLALNFKQALYNVKSYLNENIRPINKQQNESEHP